MPRIFQSIFDLFLFSSTYIALCAVVMVVQTYYLFHFTPLTNFLPFVFFGSLCSYNFHWYLTPQDFGSSYKVQWSIKNKRLHLLLFVIGLIGSAWYLWQLLPYWQWLLATAFITFLYSAPKIPAKPFIHLRYIAIGKTIFLAFAWTHITAILPLMLSSIEWKPEHYLFAVNRFFFIYAICILFDYRDRTEDKKAGIKSLITAFEEREIDIIFWSSLLVFLFTTIALHFFAFPILHISALLVPAIIVALLYYRSKKDHSDYLYHFILDGLMMFSGILLFIFSFI